MKPTPQLPLNILLADDDKSDRFFFEKALEEVSISTHLTTVQNGEQLMNYLKQNLNQLPDVLFLDINMPRKNGLECLSEIKHDEKLKPIPVVMYSTSLQEETADKLFNGGAHYYLHKCDFAELPQSIENVLTLVANNPGQPTRGQFVINWQEI
jgi:CheY-like chemotaxis protein